MIFLRKFFAKILIIIAIIFFLLGFVKGEFFFVWIVAALLYAIVKVNNFKEESYHLGDIAVFNDVLQKFITTKDFIFIRAMARDMSLKETFSRKSNELELILKDMKIIAKDHTYTIDEIKRFEIIEDDSIKKSHELNNTVNGRSIMSAASYSKQMQESRMLIICFTDENCFTLVNISYPLALSIQDAIISKHSNT